MAEATDILNTIFRLTDGYTEPALKAAESTKVLGEAIDSAKASGTQLEEVLGSLAAACEEMAAAADAAAASMDGLYSSMREAAAGASGVSSEMGVSSGQASDLAAAMEALTAEIAALAGTIEDLIGELAQFDASAAAANASVVRFAASMQTLNVSSTTVNQSLSITNNHFGNLAASANKADDSTKGFSFGMYQLRDILKNVFRDIMMVEGATLALDAAFAGISYAKFLQENTMELSFDGFLHSMQKGQEMMEYLKQTALVSPFQFMDLSKSALSLTELGVDVNRYLPDIQALAMATGQISGQGLENVVEIFRRLRGGETGLALGPRGLGRFGISRSDLEEYGAEFSKGGQFKGSIQDAFDTVDALIRQRFFPLMQEMMKAPAVQVSNLGDAIDQAMIEAGKAFNSTLLPLVKNLTDAINDLTKNSFFQDFAEELEAIFDLDPSKSSLMDGLVQIGAVVAGISQVAKNFLTTAIDVLHYIAPFAGAVLPSYGEASGFTQGYNAVMNIWHEEQDLAAKRAQHHPSTGVTAVAPDTSRMPSEDQGPDAQTQMALSNGYLFQIAQNTRELRNDFRQYAFGGNGTDRGNVTPVELSGYFGQRPTRPHGPVILGSLEDAATDVYQRMAMRSHF